MVEARTGRSKRSLVAALTVGLVLGTAIGAFAAPRSNQVGPHSTRLAGDNRYETAVAISQSQWNEQNTTTVFLATGLNFPDALALSASTNAEGPILLTLPDALPKVVGDEIARLQPCQIVAVGGTAVLTDEVIRAAEARTQREGCPTSP